jgi:hypothetical protein
MGENHAIPPQPHAAGTSRPPLVRFTSAGFREPRHTMTRFCSTATGLFAIAGVLAFAPIAQAQDVGLHLSSPGARAGAMGRAFIGVADDASTAITNPGGLMMLTKPQGYVEFRSSEVTTFPAPGVTQTDRVESLSFVSFSTPVGQRAAVGGTVHEFAHTPGFSAFSYAGTVAFAVNNRIDVGGTVSADRNGTAGTDFGVIGGVRVQANDKVSVGFVVGHNYGFVTREGFGIGVQPMARWLVAFDVTNYHFGGFADPNNPEISVGTEYMVVTGQTRVFVRAGFFNQSLFTANAHAATFGVGIASGKNFQTDISFDTNKEFIISAAVRFDKK